MISSCTLQKGLWRKCNAFHPPPPNTPYVVFHVIARKSNMTFQCFPIQTVCIHHDETPWVVFHLIAWKSNHVKESRKKTRARLELFRAQAEQVRPKKMRFFKMSNLHFYLKIKICTVYTHYKLNKKARARTFLSMSMSRVQCNRARALPSSGFFRVEFEPPELVNIFVIPSHYGLKV